MAIPQTNNEDVEIIKAPLWELMLSTNDCYPGCSCDDDFFDTTPERVRQWLESSGDAKAQQALTQLDELINNPLLDVDALNDQINYIVGNKEDAVAWLSQWRLLLVAAINSRQ